MRQNIILPFALATIIVGALTSTVLGQSASKTSSSLTRYASSGQVERGRRKTPLEIYKLGVTELIVGSTPFEQGKSEIPIGETSRVEFKVDDKGRFLNWRMLEVSESIARDFWTLYAVASCPPIKPSAEIKIPFSVDISNARLDAIVTTQEALDWRIQQGQRIPRKSDAKNIFFCLIPASFIRAFPGTVSIADITDGDNLVGIPIKSLCVSGKMTWSVKSANTFLEEKNEFLSEWSKFFKSHPLPTRIAIMKFASSLKAKYKTLLVTEGEPEAPLP